MRVAVHVDRAPTYDAEFAWQVSEETAEETRDILAKLRTQRQDTGSRIVLSIDEGARSEQRHPTEVAAADALMRMSHLRYSEALAAHEQAGQLRSRGDDSGAIEIERTGLGALGDLYVSPDLIDDTDMKVMMAESALANGRTSEAGALFNRVLESRLTAYRALHKPAPSK